ncbi:BTB/POZ domain-containing protein 3 [Exaiptasia diaphana]|nr:BTB/POZ domain-containing protein 3 [Exaiptasia diaphana]
MESSNWQTQFSTLRERNGDVNKVTIPSNKYMLATTSPVFPAMFYGHLAENKPTIDIPDCTKEGLQKLLRYAHCEEANLTGSNVMEVLYLAKKHMMPFLEKKCKKYVATEVGPEDVFSVLPQVQKMGDENLQEHLWEIVDKQTHRATSCESFLDVSKELLCQVLKRDTLSAFEVHLFEAVDKWATKQIDKRELVCEGKEKRAILGEDLIRLIRFPLMSQKEFIETVLPKKILNMDEITEVLQILNDINPAANIFINKRRRQFSLDIVISRFRNCSPNSWSYRGSVDAINLTVNKDVNLVGVRLFGREGSNYYVALKIYKYSRSEFHVPVTSSSSFMSEEIDGLYHGFTVTLHKAVRLVSGQVYILEAKISGPESYRGSDGQESVEAGDIVVTFAPASQSNNGTDVNGGQFPSLILQHL